MSDNGIEFEDEYDGSEFHIRSRKILGERVTPGMITFLIDRGVAKNEKQALTISIVLICIFVSISIFIIRSTLVHDTPIQIVDKYGRTITYDEYVVQLKKGTY
jgi:hypothetical protein